MSSEEGPGQGKVLVRSLSSGGGTGVSCWFCRAGVTHLAVWEELWTRGLGQLCALGSV